MKAMPNLSPLDLDNPDTSGCQRCLYPTNAKPTIFIDSEGICSGCRYAESYARINWAERKRELTDILSEYSARQRATHNPYDCILPVSGGKDSHYQAHVLISEYGLNPLLVTFNHTFNSALGLKNLSNLVSKFGADLVRFTISPQAARKISRYMLLSIGDLTWHYHAGIMTWPIRAAVMYKIPLIVWGEEGFAQMVGMFQLQDKVEFTRWKRTEHDMRGYEGRDLIGKDTGGGLGEIREADVTCFRYPTEEEIESAGVRGIYLGNYVPWDAHAQAKLVHERYGFSLAYERQRTFLTYSKTDDHANDVHDYLKYLKFGYGRCTDDASTEIRAGRMLREIGWILARALDVRTPLEWSAYLRWLNVDEGELLDRLEEMADGGETVRKRRAAGQEDEDMWDMYGRLQKAGIRSWLEERQPYYTPMVGRATHGGTRWIEL